MSSFFLFSLFITLIIQLVNGQNCNYIQLNDGMTWYYATDVCMKYRMNNITRSHIYSCNNNNNTILYKIYDKSDSCTGNNYNIIIEYTSKNTASMNCKSYKLNNYTINLNIYFIHGKCNINNLNYDDYQQNAIIKNECIKYNPNNSQLKQSVTYRSTIWKCNNKNELIQEIYLSQDCSGESTTKIFNGCSNDNYKYYNTICS